MAETSCDILIRNARIITMNAARTIYDAGAIAVTDRRITEVGGDQDLAARYRAGRTIDAGGGITHPGFIDAHNHIVHTTCRGVFANIGASANEPVNFADWKAGVTDEDETAATEMAGLEMLRGGFTMFIEPGSLFSTDAAAAAVEHVGLRALLSPLYLWDRPEPFEAIPSLYSKSLMARAPIDHDRAMALLDTELHRNAAPDALARGYIFIYGEGTASAELLQGAKSIARERKVPLHLHAGYVPHGQEIYTQMTGKSQLAHLQELDVLDQDTVIVHANVLDAAEEQAVRDSNCQLVWCPGAFLSLGLSGQVGFDMSARHRHGTRISLGADGAFDGTPGETFRAARFVSQHYADPLDPTDLLEMHTVNAAAAAGLHADLGSLEAGKRADIVVRSARATEGHPDNNPCHVLALTLGTGSVDTVLVDGREVMRAGRSTRVDELEINRTVSASVRARAERLGIDLGPRGARPSS